MANFWGGWTPPRHSGTWVGARVASLRCHYPPPRRSQYSRNAKARPHKSKTSGRGPLAGFEVTLYGRFWGDRRGMRFAVAYTPMLAVAFDRKLAQNRIASIQEWWRKGIWREFRSDTCC